MSCHDQYSPRGTPVQERADSTNERFSPIGEIEGHLQDALEANSAKTKNYHIRTALQVCIISDTAEQTERSQVR